MIGKTVWRCNCGQRDYTKRCECSLPNGAHEQSAHFKPEYMRGVINACPCMKQNEGTAS